MGKLAPGPRRSPHEAIVAAPPTRLALGIASGRFASRPAFDRHEPADPNPVHKKRHGVTLEGSRHARSSFSQRNQARWFSRRAAPDTLGRRVRPRRTAVSSRQASKDAVLRRERNGVFGWPPVSPTGSANHYAKRSYEKRGKERSNERSEESETDKRTRPKLAKASCAAESEQSYRRREPARGAPP